MRTVIFWRQASEGDTEEPQAKRHLKQICDNVGLRFEDWSAKRALEVLDDLERLPFDTINDGAAFVLSVGALHQQEFDFDLQSREHPRRGLAIALVLRFPHIWPIFLFEAQNENTLTETAKAAIARAQPICPTGNDGKAPMKRASIDPFMPLISDGHFLTEGKLAVGANDLKETPVCLRAFDQGVSPLFDPTGLRTLIKVGALYSIFRSKEVRSSPESTVRRSLVELFERVRHPALVADEEESIALFNAYSAYRHGRRAWTVANYKALSEGLWRRDGAWASEDVKGSAMVLRDYDLRFYDSPNTASAEEGGAEERTYRLLSDWREGGGRAIEAWSDGATWRTCSSASAVTTVDQYNRVANRRKKGPRNWRLGVIAGKGSKSLVEAERRIMTNSENDLGARARLRRGDLLIGIQKPFTSALFYTAFLQDKLRSWSERQETAMRFELTKEGHKILGRTLIARLALRGGRKASSSHHAAPPFNLKVVHSLLGQSRRLVGVRDPRAALLRGVLCSESYEIMLGKSISTALDALQGLHQAEADLETSTAGVSSNLDLRPRINDVHWTLAQLFDQGTWEGHQRANDYSVKIWSTIRTTYKNADLFGAANDANIEVLANQPWLGLGQTFWPLRRFLRGATRRSRAMTNSVKSILRRRSYSPDHLEDVDFVEAAKRDIAKVITTPTKWVQTYVQFVALFSLVGVFLRFAEFFAQPPSAKRDTAQIAEVIREAFEIPVGVFRGSLSGQIDSSTMTPLYGNNPLAIDALFWVYQGAFLISAVVLMSFFIAMIVRQVTRD